MLLQLIMLISVLFFFVSFTKADEISDPQVIISEVSQTLMQMRLQKGNKNTLFRDVSIL